MLVQAGGEQAINMPNVKAAEIRLLESRCRRLYSSPYAAERHQASASLNYLGVLCDGSQRSDECNRRP